jgi:hypothetical protein
MKKIIPLLIVILLVAGGIGGYLLYSKDKDEDKNEDKTENSQDEGQNEDEETFTLIVEEGNVLFKEDANDSYQSIDEDEIELSSGSFVKTRENSFAQIILPSNSVISIDQSTEIQIEFEENTTKIDQLLGNTWHRVKSLTEDDTYEVKTPNTIASVRGTIFSVGVAEEDNEFISGVLVEDSEVNVGRYEEDDGDIEIVDEVDLEVGEYVEVYTEEDLDIKDIPENIKNAYWYERNVALDEEIYDDLENLDIDDLREILEENSINDYDFDLNNLDSSLDLENLDLNNQMGIPGMLPTDGLNTEYDYSDFCTYYTGDDYLWTDEYRESLVPYFNASYIELLDRYFDAYGDACSDGEVTEDEWEVILEISNEFQNIDYNSIYNY